MFRKIITAVLAAAFAVMLAGCSEYVMTEEDLAVQKSIEGFWMAGSSTGYNTYDENGNAVILTIVEFTDDFRYFLHECYIDEGYIMTYDPISYSFKDKKFRVDVDGVASYAGIAVSEDGQTMYWITDAKTDAYDRLDGESARELGIPEYDREKWSEGNAGAESSGDPADSSAAQINDH